MYHREVCSLRFITELLLIKLLLKSGLSPLAVPVVEHGELHLFKVMGTAGASSFQTLKRVIREVPADSRPPYYPMLSN